MRYALVPLILAVPLAPAAAALELDFGEPATLRGGLEVLDAIWLAARLPEGNRLDVDVLAPGSLVLTNITYAARVETPWSFTEAPNGDSESHTRPMPAMRFGLVAGPGGATVAMRWQGTLAATGDVHIVGLDEDGVARLLEDRGGVHDWSPWSTLSRQGVALVPLATLQAVQLSGHATALEWLNMLPDCQGAACPSGGSRTLLEYGLPSLYVGQDTVRFERLEGAAAVRAAWPEAEVAAAARSLSVATEGFARFPVAQGVDCPTCPPIVGQTLTLEGQVMLDQIQQRPEGLRASVSGDFASARIDEQWVSPARLGQVGAVAAATVAGALALKLILTPMFTRLTKQEALEHPKRQRIFTYIQEHPGANFREVARKTDIAAGTVRHHLTVLERAGHVVEHPHQGTVRLFENHGRFDHNWADVVLLREPPLLKLHAWLAEHPGSPQKAALEAMEAVGWSRSTTQHRLARLVEGGLVTIRLQGRLKIYAVAQRMAPRHGLQGVLPANANPTLAPS